MFWRGERSSWQTPEQGETRLTVESCPHKQQGSSCNGYMPLQIQIKMQTRLPKAMQSLSLLPFVNPTCSKPWDDRESSLSISPWCHGNGSNEGHCRCRSLVVMLHCGWVDQRRGKGHGLKDGHKVKGKPPPRIPSEFMHHPRKPPDSATEAFPMRERGKQPCLSSQVTPASKTHKDACEPFSCSPHREGQLRLKQLWPLVNAIRNQNRIKTNQNGIKNIFILQSLRCTFFYIFHDLWNVFQIFQLSGSLALSFLFAAKCNKLSGGHRVALFPIFSLFLLLP